MNGAGGAGWKKVTPKFIAGFDLSQNKVNRAKAASVWLSDNGKSGDFVVFAAGTEAKKNEKGEGVVYHIDARSHAVSVAPMKLNQPTGQKKPDARVGATLTRATANTALLFGGVSVQSQDTLGDSFILTQGEDKMYSCDWSRIKQTPLRRELATPQPPTRAKSHLSGGAKKNGDVVDDAGAVFEYTVGTKKWAKLGPNSAENLPTAREKMSSFFLNDEMYIVGGCNRDACEKDMWKFTPTTSTWSKVVLDAQLNWTPRIKNGQAKMLALEVAKPYISVGAKKFHALGKSTRLAPTS